MLPTYLASIKSAGMYRFVWDKSEIPGNDAEVLRLVVGYSEKGPFNTPVYVTNEGEFKKIFGGKSRKMERYGMWFHRLALQALKAGPILALNLKNFEDSNDFTATDDQNKVELTAFNPQESIFNLNEMGEIEKNLKLAVKNLYNTDRFWTLEPEHLEDLVDEEVVSGLKENKYITLTHTDSSESSMTVFMRGFEPKGYDVSFKEWYSAVLNGEDLPTYLEGHENDLVSQFFAELYIFKGQFTPEIAANDKLSKFFDVDGEVVTLKPYLVNAFGEKIDTLSALAANDASNFVKYYQGILLPEFRNASNTVISLDAQVNGDNYQHKLMMRLNQAMLYNEEITIDQLDTTCWTLGPNGTKAKKMMMSITDLDPVVFNATYTDGEWNYDAGEHKGEAADYYKYEGLNIEAGDNAFEVKVPAKEFTEAGLREGDSLFLDGDEKEIGLTHIVKTSQKDDDSIDVPASKMENLDYEYIYDEESWNKSYENGILKKYYEWADTKGAFPYKEDYYNTETNQAAGWNDYIKNPETGEPQMFEDGYRFPETCVRCWLGAINAPIDHSQYPTLKSYYPWVAVNVPKGYGGSVEVTYNEETKEIGNVAAGKTWIIEGLPKVFSDIPSVDPTDWESYEPIDRREIVIDMNVTTVPAMRVQFDKEVVTEVDDEPTVNFTNLYKCVGSSTATSASLRPLYLKGYTYGNAKPETTKQIDKLTWQKYQLDAITNYKGLRTALTSRVDVEYRYIVDTYESFVDNECKAVLSNLAKGKDNVFAILNFPFMRSFSKCNYTSFTNEKNEFDTKYIPMGGNPLKPMGKVFSLPSQENGASWCAFYTALIIRDGDTGIKDFVPSAALVSNLFMKKYTTYLPYTIMAGPNRTIIRENGLIGADFNFSREDLDNLEPFGVNCMVYAPRKGTYINANQTAKQNPVTTLSKVNVRELVIFLQDEIEKLLTDYHWDFNTPNLRMRIKERADVILETAKNNGGVYEYLNVCDETNNTDDVINNEMLVLSTSIEPGMGAGKMVQELTIYRKGGMASMIRES